MGDEEFWTDEDEQAASAAWWQHFPNGDASWIRADVDTGRVWGGYVKGLWTDDSRIPLKDNGEYHGMKAMRGSTSRPGNALRCPTISSVQHSCGVRTPNW